MSKWLVAALLLALTIEPRSSGESAPPQASIDNGLIHAVLYLPDTERGYYRGARFDWSGVVAKLEYAHHSYFGVWFPTYEPTLHDATTGPVEEFRSADGALGFAEAIPRDMFVKIGVGVLQKPDNEPYQFTRNYKIVSTGVWVVRPHPDSIEFEQDVKPVNGYGYVYAKRVKLVNKKPEMVLEHTLKNTGKRTIETEVYDHDFYVIDAQPTGPGFSIQFPFAVQPEDSLKGAAVAAGNRIVYTRELKSEGHESVASYLTGFGTSEKDNDIRVENRTVGAGVEETINRPIAKLYLWSIRSTICPEAYIALKIAPGESAKWQTRYRFYTLPDKKEGRP